MSKQFDYSKHRRIVYIVEEHVYIWAKLGIPVEFGSSSSINGSDKMFGFKFLPLSHVHSIKDGAFRFFHVVLEEEVLCDLVRLIMNQRLKFSDGFLTDRFPASLKHKNVSQKKFIKTELIEIRYKIK